MPSASSLALFTAAALVLLLVPGPAVMYILTRSIDQGRAAGLASVLGVHLGTTVHVAAAALGVSALLASSSTAFTVVKLAGAAYLVGLGLRRILGRERVETVADGPPPARLRRVVGQGVVVNVLNPKTALFFVAFLPQFVVPARGSVTLQLLVLGAVFIVLGLLTDGLYALLGSAAGGWLRARARSRARRYVTGGAYVTLGTAAALTGSPRHP
jgi:threonine/homoserine/homoserine lactone efflux protein